MQQGLSQTTVSTLRNYFAELFYPGDPTNAGFLDQVNEILESLHNEGTWKGSTGVWTFTVSDTGHITLPYFLDSIRSLRIDDVPRWVAPIGYEFLRHGPGDLEDRGMDIAVSAGEFPYSAEWPTGSGATVTVTSSQTETTSPQMRIYGTDTNGDEILDSTGKPGELVGVGSGGATTTNSFFSITGIQKDISKGRTTMVLNTGTPVTLGTIEPGVEVPQFRRYKIDPVSTSGNGAAETVDAWCNRRFTKVVNEEDWVFPGTIRGWKLLFMALLMEDNVDQNAVGYWERGLEQFNNEIMKYEEGEESFINYDFDGLDVSPIRPVK